MCAHTKVSRVIFFFVYLHTFFTSVAPFVGCVFTVSWGATQNVSPVHSCNDFMWNCQCINVMRRYNLLYSTRLFGVSRLERSSSSPVPRHESTWKREPTQMKVTREKCACRVKCSLSCRLKLSWVSLIVVRNIIHRQRVRNRSLSGGTQKETHFNWRIINAFPMFTLFTACTYQMKYAYSER